MRVRLTLAKRGAMRFTGHLDFQRALERTLRRARLPVAYSQGFNPRPRLSLAAALPLGFTSEGEIVDVWLEGEVPLPELEAGIARAAPPGLHLQALEAVNEPAPKLPNLVRSAEYRVTLLDPVPDLEEGLARVNQADQLPRERRGKTYNLRPLIESLARGPDDPTGRPTLHMRLRALPGATGRPDEVLAELGMPAEAARVHRTRIYLSD